MKRFGFLGLTLVCMALHTTSAQRTFTNPIFDFNSADPAAYRQKIGDEVNYFISLSTSGERELTVYKSSRLSDFRNAESKVVYRAGESGFDEGDIWASEMHEVFGQVYIYFSMRRDDHRVYAIKAEDPQNPLGNWSQPIAIMGDWERGGIDLTVLKHGNGQTYATWVTDGALWIARFIENDGTKVHESHVKLRKNVNEWECCQNEGPYYFYDYEREVSYLAFSGGDTWNENYAIGWMSVPWNRDPMVPSNWYFGYERAVFQKDEEEQVYGPGHCGFTLSPDGTETWMIYHAGNSSNLFGNRIARIEKITFTDDGPVFPRPHGYSSPQNVPSGEL